MIRFTSPAVLSTVSAIALSCALLATPAHAADTAKPIVDDKVSVDDDLQKGDGSDIVVTGARRQDALAEKRDSAAVTSIMSAEEIASRPAGNIVDVIAHLPGVSGFADMGQGQAATGEREYISIRGIDSSYNAYTMNGVRVPQADPNSRALSLKLVPPYGIQAVKVTKTPTVDMDGDAIGGSIDIRTPTAFDFDASMVRVTGAGHFAQLAHDRGAAAGGAGGQAEFSRRFADHWGFYATGYYDRRNVVGETVEASRYTPVSAADAQQSDFTKVSGLAPTGVRFDYYRNRITRWGGNASLDYVNGDQRFYIQGSYANYAVNGEDTQHSIIDGIVSLYGNGKTFSPVGILPGSYFQLRDQKQMLGTVKAGGSSTMGRLSADYSMSYGISRIAQPNYIEGSLYGTRNLTGSATSIDLSDPSNVKVTFDSPATQAYTYSQETDRLWKFQGSDFASTAKTIGSRVDFTYHAPEGALTAVKFGGNVTSTDRNQYQHQFFGDNGDNFVIVGPNGEKRPYYDPAGPTVSKMPGRNLPTFMDGNYGGVFRVYDRSTFVNGALPFRYTSQFAKDPQTGATVGNPGAYTTNDYIRNNVSGNETILAGYISSAFKLADVEAIAGVRYEDTRFTSTQYRVDGNSGTFYTTRNSYGEWLPSLILSYRPSDRIVARAAARRSFSRPAFGLIAGATNITRNDITGAISAITQPNPNLKPTEAMNYDASLEYYGPASMVVELNGYYKKLDNFIYAATSAGAAPNANTATFTNGGIVTNQPENGRDASLYGMEINARRSFPELPGFLGGFGLGGSLTLQHSSADSGRADHFGRRTWLPRAPEVMANLDLFYNKDGVQMDLSYQYAGKQLVGLTGNNLDSYLQPVKSLDLSIGYRFGPVTLTAAAQNLTNNVLFYKTLGKDTRYLGTQDGGGNGSYVNTGRMFSLTASTQF